jgi:hypothetical protein
MPIRPGVLFAIIWIGWLLSWMIAAFWTMPNPEACRHLGCVAVARLASGWGRASSSGSARARETGTQLFSRVKLDSRLRGDQRLVF